MKQLSGYTAENPMWDCTTPEGICDFICETFADMASVAKFHQRGIYDQDKWKCSAEVDLDHPCGTSCCLLGWRANFDLVNEVSDLHLPLHLPEETNYFPNWIRSFGAFNGILGSSTFENLLRAFRRYYTAYAGEIRPNERNSATMETMIERMRDAHDLFQEAEQHKQNDNQDNQ